VHACLPSPVSECRNVIPCIEPLSGASHHQYSRPAGVERAVAYDNDQGKVDCHPHMDVQGVFGQTGRRDDDQFDGLEEGGVHGGLASLTHGTVVAVDARRSRARGGEMFKAMAAEPTPSRPLAAPTGVVREPGAYKKHKQKRPTLR
jgi:hypothetical protein